MGVTHSPRTVAILGMLLLSSVACGDGLFGPDIGPTVGPEHEGLRLELSFPEFVSAGDSIRFHIVLTNTDSQSYTMDSPQFDVYVMDGSGKVVWNFLHGAVIIGPGPTILPGETYEFDHVWLQNENEGSGTVSAGVYLVFSVFYSGFPPALVSETEAITILRE